MKILFLYVLTIFAACNSNKKIAQTNTTKEETKVVEVVTPTPNDNPNATQFTVRIIRVSCASIVAIITDETKLDKGESWAPYNVRMAKPYKGAFTITNMCDFSNVKEGDNFLATVLAPEEAKGKVCAVCAMADYPPATSYNIKISSDIKNHF